MNTLTWIFGKFPAGMAFVCGFLVCLLFILILIHEIEAAKPGKDDDDSIDQSK